MAPRRTAVLVSVALLFAGIETSIGNAQETPAPVKAVQLIGLTTYDFAKNAARVTHENFSSTENKQ